MAVYSDSKWGKFLVDNERRFEAKERLKNNPSAIRKRKQNRVIVYDTASTAGYHGYYSRIDSEPVSVLLPCAERGCLFPGRRKVYDQWGSQVYCQSHYDGLQAGKSLIDSSSNPLVFETEGSSGRRILRGIKTFRAPLPLFFGLRVPYAKLEHAGKLIVSENLLASTVAKRAALGIGSVRKFALNAGLKIKEPYSDRTSKYQYIHDAFLKGDESLIVDAADPENDRARIYGILKSRKYQNEFCRFSVTRQGETQLLIKKLVPYSSPSLLTISSASPHSPEPKKPE